MSFQQGSEIGITRRPHHVGSAGPCGIPGVHRPDRAAPRRRRGGLSCRESAVLPERPRRHTIRRRNAVQRTPPLRGDRSAPPGSGRQRGPRAPAPARILRGDQLPSWCSRLQFDVVLPYSQSGHSLRPRILSGTIGAPGHCRPGLFGTRTCAVADLAGRLRSSAVGQEAAGRTRLAASGPLTPGSRARNRPLADRPRCGAYSIRRIAVRREQVAPASSPTGVSRFR